MVNERGEKKNSARRVSRGNAKTKKSIDKHSNGGEEVKSKGGIRSKEIAGCLPKHAGAPFLMENDFDWVGKGEGEGGQVENGDREP